MIHDLEQGVSADIQRAEVLIVGAGASGILLAAELARKGTRVLVLESGGRDEEPATTALYKSDLPSLQHQGIHLGRHRVYGGSTTKWGGQILELFEDDFPVRSWVEGSGWPFPKETLREYYDRAIPLEGLGSAMLNDRDVWQRVKVTLPDYGPELFPFFSRYCPELNFSRLFDETLSNHPNLQVVLHANACELLFAEDGETISGVRAQTLSGKEAIFTADRVVLCLGGIEVLRFLLQPHAAGASPWHANPHLGLYFQDHLAVNAADLTDLHPRFHDYFDPVSTQGYRYEPRFRMTLDRQQREKILTVAGMVFFDSDENDPRHRVWQAMKHLVKGRIGQIPPGGVKELMSNLPMLYRQMYRYAVQGRSYTPDKGTRFKLRVFCEQEPLGASRVTLSSEKDALGQFRAKLDWRVSELEIETVRGFVKLVRDVFEKKKLARVTPIPELADTQKLMPKVEDTYHHMGGARMAVSPADGVVDLDLKVHGTRNLHVCSSAVYPASGFSNPTHTLFALTVRLADHLRASAKH